MIKNNTKIFSITRFCGLSYMKNKLRYDNVNISILDLTKETKLLKRKRTDKELEALKEWWESEQHLMSGEGYINQIRNDLVTCIDPNYTNKILNKVKEGIGVYDFIFISHDHKVDKILYDNNIKFSIIYPDITLKYEFTGRCVEKYAKISKDYPIEYLSKFFYKIHEIENEIYMYNIDSIKLKCTSLYLYDVFKDIYL